MPRDPLQEHHWEALEDLPQEQHQCDRLTRTEAVPIDQQLSIPVEPDIQVLFVVPLISPTETADKATPEVAETVQAVYTEAALQDQDHQDLQELAEAVLQDHL